MCQRVTCPKCKKATFAGCGRHVEQVLQGVPKEERCACDQQVAAPSGEPAPRRKGWWPFA